MLSACSHEPLSIPIIDKNQVLVTHIKDPKLAVIDLMEGDIIDSLPFEFTVQSMTNIGSNKVALAGRLESEVLLIDLNSGQVNSLISDIPGITELYFKENEEWLLMTNAQFDEINIYDMNKRDELQRIQVGSFPIAMAVDDDLLYVVNGDDGTVSVVDLRTNEVLTTYDVLERPTDILVVGDYFAVAGHGSFGDLNEYIYLYKQNTGELVEKIKVGFMPIKFYVDQHSEDIAVLCHGSNEMYLLDKAAFTVHTKVATGENPYYVTGDENYLYVTGLDGDNLLLFDRKTYVKKAEFSVFSGPYGIVLGGR